MPDLETRLPELFRRVAAGGPPSPDLEHRVLRRARGRRVVNASVAGLAAIGLLAATFLGARELMLSNRVTPGDESPSPGPGITSTHLQAVWPETTAEDLAAAQAQADAGELGWRLDPVQTAARFAVEILGWDPADVRAVETGRPRIGTAFVTISNLGLGPGADSSTPPAPETMLTLRQLGDIGERTVWTVTRADTQHIEVVSFNEPAGRVSPVGSLTDVRDEWQLDIWPIVDGELLVELSITSDARGRVDVRDGSFTASLTVPRELVPEGTNVIGVLLGLWDPEGTVVAAEAFPYDVTSLGWEPTGPTGAGVTGSTGPGTTGPTGPGEQIPSAVLSTRDQIAVAAENRDVDALGRLIGPDFSYNFDVGSVAVDQWRDDPAPLDKLAAILQMPFTTTKMEGLGTIYVWPALMDSDLTNPTDEDRAMLEALGITERDVQDMLDGFGGYAGPRTVITEDGTWSSFTIGGD